MKTEELVEQYKNNNLKVRLAICLTIGLAVGYFYFDSESGVFAELEQAEQKLTTTRAQLATNQKKVRDLPNLEKNYSDTLAELTRLGEELPMTINLGKVLGKLSEIEQSKGIKISSFKPGPINEIGNKIPITQQAITLAIEGDYRNVVQFLDHIVHLSHVTHLREVKIDRYQITVGTQVVNIVKAEANLVIFRST